MPHFLDMLEEIRVSLDAARAFGELSFPFFIEKRAPVSGHVITSYSIHYTKLYDSSPRDSRTAEP